MGGYDTIGSNRGDAEPDLDTDSSTVSGFHVDISASVPEISTPVSLIVIVAVFLAYNANNGLPFVPTYRISVVVPSLA